MLAIALASTAWLADSVRTQGVADELLHGSRRVSVLERADTLEFLPASPSGRSALIFICGSGVAAQAYAPLLRPIAEAGYPVFMVKLPYRFAPLDSHKDEAVARTGRLIAANAQIGHWVISGHSLGGALAARFADANRGLDAALVLIGTTHPKAVDLSTLEVPVTKIYATNDGIAPPDRVLANRQLLPASTGWVEIEGGNHSQFGHYGHQLLDRRATISREVQQALTRSALLEALQERPSAAALTASSPVAM